MQNIKQAVILSAGKSSRFTPFGEVGHKAEISLFGKPILYWTLDSLVKLNFSKVVVVVGKDHQHLQWLLENYPKKFQSLQVVIQEKPQGQADALLSAKHLLDEQFIMIDSNQCELEHYLPTILEQKTKIVLAVNPTDQPQLYGVVRVDNHHATAVIEKPFTTEKNLQRIIGIYLLSKDFVDLMSQKSPAEYLLEESLDEYVKDHEVAVAEFQSATPSLKYPWHLFDFKDLLFKKIVFNKSSSAQIANTAQIRGDVFIGNEAIIGDFAVVEGPAYIGNRAVVGRYSVLRAGSVLESEAEIQSYADCNNSILLKGAHLHSGFIGNSILGENVRIGAGFVSANRRLDRAPIQALVKDQKIDTGTTRLGVIIGHRSKLGVQVATMPNVIIGNDVIIGPAQVIKHNVSSGTKIL